MWKSAARGSDILVAALLAAALVAAFHASAEESKKLQQIEEDLAKADAAAKALEEHGSVLQAELDGLRKRLVAAASAAQEAEEELTSLSNALAELEAEERKKAEDLAHRRSETAVTLAALQRLALRPADALIAAPGTPLDTVRGALLLKAALPALTERSTVLRGELESLAQVREEIARSQTALDRAAAERSAAAAEIGSLIDAKAALLSETQAAGRKSAEWAAALAADAKDLRDLIARLEAERERAKAVAARRQVEESPVDEEFLALPRRLKPPEEAPAEVAVLGPQAVPLIERPTLVRPFPEAPGGLIMPVRGRVARYFDPAAESEPLSKGLLIETLPGAQVVAPFDGHVAFQGPFRGYGSILIIEHAGGYHTLLSGFGRIDAAVGQWLLAGEPVGVMGPQRAPALYIELRRASQPIDPLPWLRISGDKVKG